MVGKLTGRKKEKRNVFLGVATRTQIGSPYEYSTNGLQMDGLLGSRTCTEHGHDARAREHGVP